MFLNLKFRQEIFVKEQEIKQNMELSDFYECCLDTLAR